MKTVSSNFQVAQNKEVTKTVYRVYYKRRYWNGAAYAWEGSWTEVAQDELVGIDAPVHALDTITFNEFQVSNTVLRFRNDLMQWKEGAHSSSKFLADGTATFGYEPYLMKFQIKAGFRNVGETDLRVGERVPGIGTGHEEMLSIFTGVGVEYWFDSDQRVAYVRASGLEELLFNADASRVSTTSTLETLGTGDGSTKEFYTAQSGVGRIRAVTVNSVTQTPGTDYVIENLNSLENSAKITLAQAAASTYLVKCTYDYWKTNKTVDSLITDLVVEAGIASYAVDSASLGTVSNNVSQTSRSDFEAGTNVAVNTSTLPGTLRIDYDDSTNRSLLDDFSAGSLGGNGWSAFTAPGINFDQISGECVMNAVGSGSSINNAAGIKRSLGTARVFGEWRWDVKGQVGTEVWDVILTSVSAITYAFYRDGTGTLYFYIYNSSGAQTEVFSTTTASIGTSYKTIKMIKSAIGEIKIYVDSTLVIEAVDESERAIDGIVLGFVTSGTSPATKVYFDNIYQPTTSLTASHISQGIDCGTGISAWGNLTVSQESPAGVFSYESKTSDDNITYTGLTAVSATNGILSLVKRYIKIKISWSLSTASLPLIEPVAFDYTVQFTGTNVYVAMAQFTELNCFQAVQELAKMTDFEWGFDDDENFFFRSRTASSTPDVTFNSNSNLSEIIALTSGFDRVFSTYRASFGAFFSESVSTSGVRTSPVEIFGRRIFQIGSAILINKDTNLADSLVAIYKARFQYKKRRAKILTKFWPQIELSDTVSLTFSHDSYSTPAVEPMLNAFIGKVLSTRHDPMNSVSEFEVEEIL